MSKDLKIGKVRRDKDLYFVYIEKPKWTDLDTGYLHKDGTFHNYCGIENFFTSREEAQQAINEYYGIDFQISLEDVLI